MRPDLSDDEIDAICGGLTQNAAKVRFLQSLGLPVARRPNGRPLVWRTDWDKRNPPQPANPADGPRWKVAA